jgi:hypothetical protein
VARLDRGEERGSNGAKYIVAVAELWLWEKITKRKKKVARHWVAVVIILDNGGSGCAGSGSGRVAVARLDRGGQRGSNGANLSLWLWLWRQWQWHLSSYHFFLILYRTTHRNKNSLKKMSFF